ncbi:energy transducer TonB [Castellaniella sp.]|uniref:energy transducer TonB n=1 Tax=Castellaniella sp. TaxID=1955812 RepID=UPI002AFEACEC|nr:energy transducer TonB [Castellaniella sp.]
MGSGSSLRFSWLRALAAVVALGLHAAVLAMVLSAPVAQVALGQPDALEVQFVELGPAVDASAQPAELPEIPEPEPIVEPEPVVEPEPEPVVEQPEPESITEAAPPKPTPKPKPKPKPRLKPQPAHEAPPAAVTPAVTAPAGGARQTALTRGEQQAVDPDRPRTIGRVDYLGKRPSPIYPRLAQRRGEQGRVLLRVLISPQGEVAQVKVQRSSGYERLDEAAIQAMQRARFRPYTENGIAYKALVDIPFDFVL